MTKYLLADRERNGYDDSDFYAVFWDTETQTIRSEEYGSTRYPSPRVAPTDEYLRDIPEGELQKARIYFQDRLETDLIRADHYLRDNPHSLKYRLLQIVNHGRHPVWRHLWHQYPEAVVCLGDDAIVFQFITQSLRDLRKNVMSHHRLLCCGRNRQGGNPARPAGPFSGRRRLLVDGLRVHR